MSRKSAVRWLWLVVILVVGLSACRERQLQSEPSANVPLEAGGENAPQLQIPTVEAGAPTVAALPGDQTGSAETAYPAPEGTTPSSAEPGLPGTDQGGQTPGGGETPVPADGLTAAPLQDVIYTVQNGDTIGEIALTYGVEIADIALVNGLTDLDAIQIGQTLIIPLSGNLATPIIPPTPVVVETPEPTVAPVDRIHIVQSGETLYKISLAYGVDMNVLAAYNNLADPTLIYAGQELRIPPAQP